MLAQAQGHMCEGLTFQKGDIQEFGRSEVSRNGKYDLIFSNAAIQWVGQHQVLIESLSQKLNVGGQIAIQVPTNHDHPSHRIAHRIAKESPFKEALQGYSRIDTVYLQKSTPSFWNDVASPVNMSDFKSISIVCPIEMESLNGLKVPY
jgi:trans-aconitate 2-methyltransferase